MGRPLEGDNGVGTALIRFHVPHHDLDHGPSHLEIFESVLDKSDGFTDPRRRVAALFKSCFESCSGREAVRDW